MDNTLSPRIMVVCTDLIFSTKITGTAKALGQPCAVARTPEKLAELLANAPPEALLIVDLNAAGLDPLAAIQLAKAHAWPPRVVAFLSHVQADLAAAARQAGADQVLARSAFTERLPEILAAAKVARKIMPLDVRDAGIG
jgi:DNA-binding NarL/FixJ family response regulator